MNVINALHLQLQLLQAQIFQSISSTHFTLSISSKGKQYNTSTFSLVNHHINLKSCSPINLSMHQTTLPFLKVTLSSCDNTVTYKTQVDFKVVEAILTRAKTKKRHVLAFPLFGRTHNVIGELKIKLKIISNHQVIHQDQHRKERQNRHQIISSSEDYFQPVYSKMIKVSIYDNTPQQNQDEEQHQNIEEYKPNSKNEFFEPFREEISEIEVKQNHEGRLNEQQQRQMAYLASSNRPQRQYNQQDMPDIPQDCQHLFQKINQINRRYAPLEKIPSQEEFSDYSQLNQGDYKIPSDVQEQVSHPLQEVQELLKQLDLYKFAQNLHPEEQSNS